MFRITRAFFLMTALIVAPAQSEPISLCQLFKNLDSHHGQKVTLRATYRFGREVAGLYSESCEQTVMLDGHEVQPHVYLVFPEPTASSEPSTTNFEAFSQSVDDASTKPNAITLTVTGILRTRSQSAPLIGKNGKPSTVRMFGHLGAFPAELQVESIDKVDVAPNSRTPSSFALEKSRR